MSQVAGHEAGGQPPGCSPATHTWFVEVYTQLRQMAYDLRLEELHDVARRLEAVHRVVHPPVEVRLSVPRGPDERARMSAFVDEVLSTASSAPRSTHDDDRAGPSPTPAVVEGSPHDLLDVSPPDNPSDETF